MISKKDKQYADRIIAVMRAWKKGAQIQRKSNAQDWHDVELRNLIDNRAIQYRVKPSRKRKAT